MYMTYYTKPCVLFVGHLNSGPEIGSWLAIVIAGFLSCVVRCVCRSHRLEIYFRNKPLKIFVSETIGPEALIFGV